MKKKVKLFDPKDTGKPKTKIGDFFYICGKLLVATIIVASLIFLVVVNFHFFPKPI